LNRPMEKKSNFVRKKRLVCRNEEEFSVDKRRKRMRSFGGGRSVYRKKGKRKRSKFGR